MIMKLNWRIACVKECVTKMTRLSQCIGGIGRSGCNHICYCGGSSHGRRKERSDDGGRFVDGVGVGVDGVKGGKERGCTGGENGEQKDGLVEQHLCTKA